MTAHHKAGHDAHTAPGADRVARTGRAAGRRTRTAFAGVVGLLLALLLGTVPASAHNVLTGSSPSDGDELTTPPETVTLTFDQPVQDAGTNEIAVTGPDGANWVEGPVRADGSDVTVALRPLGPEGEYVIGFRVLSADGHPVSDEIRFTLTEPGPGTAGNTPGAATTGEGTPQAREAPESVVPDGADEAADQDDSDGGIPAWVWVIGAVALLTIGLALALRMGRSGEQ